MALSRGWSLAGAAGLAEHASDLKTGLDVPGLPASQSDVRVRSESLTWPLSFTLAHSLSLQLLSKHHILPILRILLPSLHILLDHRCITLNIPMWGQQVRSLVQMEGVGKLKKETQALRLALIFVAKLAFPLEVCGAILLHPHMRSGLLRSRKALRLRRGGK